MSITLIKTKKDKKAHYKVTIELPRGTTGKRKRISRTITGTKKQAEHLEYELMEKYKVGEAPEKKAPLTVEQWMKDWITVYHKGKSPTTINGYKSNIKTHIIPAFGDMPLENLNQFMVQKWVNSLYDSSTASDKPLSAKTVRNIYLNLESACNKAVLAGKLDKNPCTGIELKPSRSKSVNPYTKDEISKLLTAIKGTDLELPITLDIALGLRRGELLALQWSDVDFANNRIHVHRNLVMDENRKMVTKEPKTPSGNRKITISDKLAKLLHDNYLKHLSGQSNIKLIPKYDNNFDICNTSTKKDDGFIICNPDGTPYNPDTFSSKFRRFLEKHGLRKIRLHDIRHTTCTQLLMNGVDLKTCQAIMGHASYQITADTYSHVLPEAESNAASVTDSFVFNNL